VFWFKSIKISNKSGTQIEALLFKANKMEIANLIKCNNKIYKIVNPRGSKLKQRLKIQEQENNALCAI